VRLPWPLLLERRHESVPLLRSALHERPDTLGLRDYLAAALQGHARDLRAQGLGANVDALVVEARTLREGGAGARP